MKTSEFIQGIAYAVAELNRGHDQPTMCRDVLNATGFAIEDFERVVDEYDMKEIRKVWNRPAVETTTDEGQS